MNDYAVEVIVVATSDDVDQPFLLPPMVMRGVGETRDDAIDNMMPDCLGKCFYAFCEIGKSGVYRVYIASTGWTVHHDNKHVYLYVRATRIPHD